jgi:hypothetical protein
MATFSPKRSVSISGRLYRLLLRVYPLEFRHVYGPKMAQVFRDCCRAAHQQRGTMGVLHLWIFTLYDLATNALAEQISTLVYKRRENNLARQCLIHAQKQSIISHTAERFQRQEGSMFDSMSCPCFMCQIGDVSWRIRYT